ncbi:bifunctional PLP-dependent enzyme with beta-cystathionase and maltose regulon repressor activities [Mesotoga prima MesG1.Ag.4.2]|uniref:cysteine-S-conjugate beta-lyase n=1 Tax=Mesotoga prima MesG1.Ag.4.2 TaxID=660470 RepID=I2F858_9BACT|nr:PatB family C-S lyase [Mesotoga prima]AFK08111.1 bifunctional PLP-dependent enzyme with beta-cystathionase and maltose regulon repressor activities [Mesotoga prima MesG1.Ag.4.2]
MDYDFDTLVNRENQGNMKCMLTPDIVKKMNLISYAGAEMDFKTAPAIIDALVERARNGLLGFTLADEKYLSSVQWWMKNMRNWEIERDWIVPTYGTIHSVATAIRAFTKEGDGVIVQPPVYNRYEQAVRRTNREIVSNPLIYGDGKYSMDFDDLERCMRVEKNRLFLLCNPHNPIAKVWQRSDLEKISSLAQRYNVLVFSDEIFGEITFNGNSAIPYSTVAGDESNSIVATSLGKVFNLTGVNSANIVIPDPSTRKRFRIQRDADHYGSIDPMVHAAVCAGYGPDGADWVREMREYVWENVSIMKDFFTRNIPAVTMTEVEGSFVIWIDWRRLKLDDEELHSFLLNEAYLDLDRGINYGEGGEGFTRMNIAAPRRKIEESLGFLFEAAARRGYAVSETLNRWR